MTTSAAKESVGSDSVRLYLNEIGQVGLLTADEERDLGRKIKAGLVAQVKLNSANGGLDFAERRKLQRITKDGEKAKDHMVRANLRLVVGIANCMMSSSFSTVKLLRAATSSGVGMRPSSAVKSRSARCTRLTISIMWPGMRMLRP